MGADASIDVHLVDGTYELFRAFYGAPPATSPDGREVGATRGLLRSLLALLNQDGVTHAAVAFDHVIESFRNELFAGYKTGAGIDPQLMAQFPLAERAAEALGLVVWPMVQFEADDALATAAANWSNEKAVRQVLLCSPDKDLAQCVSQTRVVMLDRRRGQVLDEAAVRQKWGVPPTSIPDYLALVGDPADGIPGIPKWGAKSASTALAAYGSLENIPDDVKQWNVSIRGANGLARNLTQMRSRALLYKTLATLRTDVPLPHSLSDAQWRGADRQKLQTLCSELGDQRMIQRVSRWRCT